MTSLPRPRRALIAAVVSGLAIVASAAWATPAAAACGFGKPLEERLLMRPRPGSFFSVDALNPDVVRRGRRYLLFFSGNSIETDSGLWHTGLAVASRPLGPFRVDIGLSEDFLNGGTIFRRGRFLTAANVPGRLEPVLFESSDGRAWRARGVKPAPGHPSWRLWQSDLYLDRRPGGFDAYFAGRSGPTGADIGVGHERAGGWSGFHRVLARRATGWDRLDLGEPAVFEAGGHRYMLYGGLEDNGGARSIGLARLTRTGWHRCGRRPFIRAGRRWYASNAIDPEPVVDGRCLYVYFGGGLRPSLGGNMRGVIGVRVYRLPVPHWPKKRLSRATAGSHAAGPRSRRCSARR